MIDILKDTLTKVNDWIKFAEAKNAANIALCSTLIIFISRIIVSDVSYNEFFCYYLYYSIAIITISCFISLLSFIPKLDFPWIIIGDTSKDDNFLYFGHACKYSPTKYLSLLYSGEDLKKENINLEMAYAKQIVVNSRIAYIKFKQFDIAIWFIIAVFATPVGALIAYWLRR